MFNSDWFHAMFNSGWFHAMFNSDWFHAMFNPGWFHAVFDSLTSGQHGGDNTPSDSLQLSRNP